jgi:hypothetical protein
LLQMNCKMLLRLNSTLLHNSSPKLDQTSSRCISFLVLHFIFNCTKSQGWPFYG